MNKKILGAISALAILAGAAVAFQFASASTTNENIIAARLEGRWVVDTDITARLDPDPAATPPRSLEFARDDQVWKQLQQTYPRYQNDAIYMAGTAILAGTKHWFVVMNKNGNALLMLFTPTRGQESGEPHQVFINMVCSREKAKDLLFLGGNLARESAVAYKRLIN
jgi:hypothetical protein